jgi:hypothetical protein
MTDDDLALRPPLPDTVVDNCEAPDDCERPHISALLVVIVGAHVHVLQLSTQTQFTLGRVKEPYQISWVDIG